MGEFRVTVTAVGGHGCQREFGDGEHVVGCERTNCPDCISREYVRRLKRSGAVVSFAELLHWPHEVAQVRDDLLSSERRGSFPERERYLAEKQATQQRQEATQSS